MTSFDALIRDATAFLEHSRTCPKHHVSHTGSLCYLLDFYGYVGRQEDGARFVRELVATIRTQGSAKVFYPGLADPYNMSNNVIDSGSCVDAIARFCHLNKGAFGDDEHARIKGALREVVETYLAGAAADKPITNQRLWGLTGVASFARYAGEEEKYRDVVRRSIERAFADMTVDGFFRYYPGASRHASFAGYDGISEFYQSRHIAFIRYSLEALGMDSAPYEENLQKAEHALLAMYGADGIKDLRLECKRWYWLSGYEVAASGFDSYALARSDIPEAKPALHNALYQVRRHFFDGYLHSHIGAPINFQCPIFWTAHLAWTLRINGIEKKFDGTDSLESFSFEFKGQEVYAKTSATERVLIDARWSERNPTVGIFDNGLPTTVRWHAKMPNLPPRLGLSAREVLNQSFAALRGGCVREALLRLSLFARECVIMLLPRYATGWGKVTLLYKGGIPYTEVAPASKYGTLL